MSKKLGIFLAALTLGPFLEPVLAQDSEVDSESVDQPETVAKVDDIVVVTASRTVQKLYDVPANITVLTAEQIENAPADDYGDLLRTIPGVNVTQLNARDINVSSALARIDPLLLAKTAPPHLSLVRPED